MQVTNIEQLRSKNSDMLSQLDKRNSELTEQKKNIAAEFEDARSGIAPEDTAAVQEERLAVRDEVMGDIRSRLQEMYGRKYSYEELKAATNTVSHELNETPPLKKSIRNILLKKHSQAIDANKVKKHEHEL